MAERLEYYRRRAADERRIAASIDDSVAAGIHLQLAALYERAIEEMEGGAGPLAAPPIMAGGKIIPLKPL